MGLGVAFDGRCRLRDFTYKNVQEIVRYCGAETPQTIELVEQAIRSACTSWEPADEDNKPVVDVNRA